MLQIAPENSLELDFADDDEIFCANCDHSVTRSRWRIAVNGDHQHTVFNPAGQLFRVVCFKDAPGVDAVGLPSTEFTWFKGHAWQIGHCKGCGVHIGWRFKNGDEFYGLIGDRLQANERRGNSAED